MTKELTDSTNSTISEDFITAADNTSRLNDVLTEIRSILASKMNQLLGVEVEIIRHEGRSEVGGVPKEGKICLMNRLAGIQANNEDIANNILAMTKKL